MGQVISSTPINHNEVDISWMAGSVFANISLIEPSAWRIEFFGGQYLLIECPWRLIEKRRIAVSCDDQDQSYGLSEPIDAAAKARDFLNGREVSEVELSEGTADLRIEFGDDVRLEILPFSIGYESWQLSMPTGEILGALGGGNFEVWSRDT